MNATHLKEIFPVLPSQNIEKDIKWYKEKVGFEFTFGDDMYAELKREHFHLHLQWHADTPVDPIFGGSVIRIFVEDIPIIFQDFFQRGTVKEDKLRRNTPSHEFGFYVLNNNPIFMVQDV